MSDTLGTMRVTPPPTAGSMAIAIFASPTHLPHWQISLLLDTTMQMLLQMLQCVPDHTDLYLWMLDGRVECSKNTVFKPAHLKPISRTTLLGSGFFLSTQQLSIMMGAVPKLNWRK